MDAGKTYTVILDYDNETGDVILPLSDDIMKEAGWNLGDEIEWIDNENGSWTMKKVEKEQKEWVLVECVQQYRTRYMCEVPKGKAEWALDTVTLNQAKEFSQQDLGETIVSHRVMGSVAEALVLCDLDNDYCSTWNDDHKIKCFFTKDGEKVEL